MLHSTESGSVIISIVWVERKKPSSDKNAERKKYPVIVALNSSFSLVFCSHLLASVIEEVMTLQIQY